MTVREFQEQLRRTGAYQTDPQAAGRWGNRGPCGCGARYYARIFGIVVRAYLQARRGRYDPAAWSASSCDVLRAIEACGGRVSISGLQERGRYEGPVVYASNHMSMLETFLLPCILLSFGGLTTVVKTNLLRYPLFGRILGAVRPISLGRRDPRADLQAVLEGAGEAVKTGRSVLVFPQHTRRPYFNEAEFNTLGVKVARRAGAPVVPVALKTDFQGIGRVFRDFGPIDPSRTVQASFGPPLKVTDSGRECHRQVVAFIRSRLQAWGVAVVAAEGGRGGGAAGE